MIVSKFSVITDFLRNVQSGEEARSLQNLRQTLAARSNSTAETIKDVVFDHYKQFIDTSKEISSRTWGGGGNSDEIPGGLSNFENHANLKGIARLLELLFVSELERDIYQLSSLLNEQKNLIENLMEMSGHDKRSSCSTSLYSSSSGVNQQNQQLQIVMQKMDGVAVIAIISCQSLFCRFFSPS